MGAGEAHQRAENSRGKGCTSSIWAVLAALISWFRCSRYSRTSSKVNRRCPILRALRGLYPASLAASVALPLIRYASQNARFLWFTVSPPPGLHQGRRLCPAQACISPGFPARRVLVLPEIVERLQAVHTAQMEEVRQFWTATMRDENMKPADRLKASELLAKTYGTFLKRC